MFEGIITPLVTPFDNDENQNINYEETYKLIDKLINKGVRGLFILGSNGEFYNLSSLEKLEFIKNIVNYVNKRIKVMAGIGACSLIDTIYLAKNSEKLGVDALSLVGPYFVVPDEEELFNYFLEVSKSVEIPIVLYNIPKFTGYNISNELFEKLLNIKNIIGIKDSSGNTELLDKYIISAKKYNKDVYVGSDSKISYGYFKGAKGAIASTSNFITKTLVNLWDSLENNDLVKAEEYQKDIDVFRNILKLATIPNILKRSIKLANIADVGSARKPFLNIEDRYDKEIMEVVDYFNKKGGI